MVYCAAIGCNSLSGRDKQYASECTQTSISMADQDTQTDWEKDVPSTTINLPDVNLERTHESILDISDVRCEECDTTWNANDSDDSSDEESFEDVSDNEAINFVYDGERKFIVYESHLDQLIDSCVVCGKKTIIDKTVYGAQLSCSIYCGNCESDRYWYSQPAFSGVAQGHLKLATSIMCSGIVRTNF
ncbi:hypothetical protein ACF0H5_018759 [Mactra antiquata]